MSWNVSEFTATSVEAAKAECRRQVTGDGKDAVLALLDAAIDHCGLYPGLHLYVRGFGHKAGQGGNLLLEIKPATPPKDS